MPRTRTVALWTALGAFGLPWLSLERLGLATGGSYEHFIIGMYTRTSTALGTNAQTIPRTVPGEIGNTSTRTSTIAEIPARRAGFAFQTRALTDFRAADFKYEYRTVRGTIVRVLRLLARLRRMRGISKTALDE
eukprot:scaffold53142_cov25-Prasinocladus_malaysianus.AAC.1